MEQYDTHATADPFACSVNAFETLMGTLSGDQASAWTHAELEEHLDAAGRELLRQLLQDHLVSIGVFESRWGGCFGSRGCIGEFGSHLGVGWVTCR
jgi:hypothetical protein